VNVLTPRNAKNCTIVINFVVIDRVNLGEVTSQ